MKRLLFVLALSAAVHAGPGLAAPAEVALKPCRLPGVAHDAACGQLRRALDPARPDGTQIDVHFAVLPALARNKHPDPVFFLAGGPGQSAIDLAGPLAAQFARVLNRRDVVLVDQRGTGRSAPLMCDAADPTQPLREMFDPERQRAQLDRCREQLAALPYGDLRFFTTTLAMADLDAVRQALGVERVNLVGASYGTRAALEYLRLYPQRVRRSVLDGVVPPDMVLPQAATVDTQAAFDALLNACRTDAACTGLTQHWARLRASLPREVQVTHPFTGGDERLTVTAGMLASLVRQPLYRPWLAAALPVAIERAANGRFDSLLGVAAVMVGRRGAPGVAEGMHFSVICSEDGPRMREGSDEVSGDFGSTFGDLYRDVCAHWPRGAVPAAFYDVPPARTPTLLLSGALDPATPPRHAARVADRLGPMARHVVVAGAGHGVMGIGCLRDVLFRFIDEADDHAALMLDAGCASAVPRPPAFRPGLP